MIAQNNPKQIDVHFILIAILAIGFDIIKG